MIIPAESRDVLEIGTSMASVSSTTKRKLTDIIEITPAVLSFNSSTITNVNIEVSNHHNRPVLIHPSATIAGLKQVSFGDDFNNSSQDEQQVINKEVFLQQFYGSYIIMFRLFFNISIKYHHWVH